MMLTARTDTNFLDKSLTFRQRINKLGQEINNNEGAVAMLGAVAGFLLPI